MQPDDQREIRLGYLRAALDRLAKGEFRSAEVMAVIAQAALDLDDTLKDGAHG